MRNLKGKLCSPAFRVPRKHKTDILLKNLTPHERMSNPFLEKKWTQLSQSVFATKWKLSQGLLPLATSKWERMQHLHDSRSPPCPHLVPVWSHVFFPGRCTQTPTAKTKPVIRNAGSDRVEFQLQGCSKSRGWEPFTWGVHPRIVTRTSTVCLWL